MESYIVDKRTMLLVYDFTVQDIRKDLRGTGNWRAFWNDFPFKKRMTTYNSIRRGKLVRIIGYHTKVKGVLCPHQVRLTIAVEKCRDTEENFTFKIEELQACACADSKLLMSINSDLGTYFICSILPQAMKKMTTRGWQRSRRYSQQQ